MLKSFTRVGTGACALVGAIHFASPRNASMTGRPSATAALSPQEWRAFPVIEKKQVTKDSVHVRFGLPEAQVLGLTVASCLITRAQIGKEAEDQTKGYVIRPYTPVSPPDSQGSFDLVIKVYPNGNMSKHIGSLQVGDTLEFKGPIQKLEYQPNMKKQIGMIAGGSGITPMLQVADAILSNPDDKTEVSLIYASQSSDNIILKDKIDEMANKHDQFKVYYVVDKPAYGGVFWNGGVGYITGEMISKFMPDPSNDDGLVLVCGPPPMMNAISGDKAQDKTQGELSGLLAALHYRKENVYKF